MNRNHYHHPHAFLLLALLLTILALPSCSVDDGSDMAAPPAIPSSDDILLARTGFEGGWQLLASKGVPPQNEATHVVPSTAFLQLWGDSLQLQPVPAAALMYYVQGRELLSDVPLKAAMTSIGYSSAVDIFNVVPADYVFTCLVGGETRQVRVSFTADSKATYERAIDAYVVVLWVDAITDGEQTVRFGTEEAGTLQLVFTSKRRL